MSFTQTVVLQQQPPPIIDTAAFLELKPRITAAFPNCSSELLALIRTNQTEPDDITKYFNEYFKFRRHQVFGEVEIPGSVPQFKDLAEDLPTVLDPGLVRCAGTRPAPASLAASYSTPPVWPTECCICSPCVTLDGNRNALGAVPPGTVLIPPNGPVVPRIRRLFVGDLLWLFYFDRMGVFQILGAILDAFASNGRLPISNGSLDVSVSDDVVALVLEVMVRQTKTGLSSSVRDRGCAYRTCLGWVTDNARKLNLDTAVNTGFNNLFHKFIYHALEFYRERRLAIAIQGAAAPAAAPSVATLITISDTLDVLKKRFETFDYGRNYYNTLAGIVWAIAGMSVIRALVQTLGIPPAYNNAHEFIPAAYDLLVLKRPVTQGDMNRYDLHRLCAENGRDLLLDVEVVNFRNRTPRGDLENWLVQVESKVEAYRTAYRTLTGVDLGAGATPTIDQAVS
jgi:hypothetical protein